MISRNQSLALFLILCILLACGFLYILNISHVIKEGFEGESLETSYTQVQTSLKDILAKYCYLTEFVQDQMMTMYKADKVSESGVTVPGDSSSEAKENIRIAYENAYACKDELASSRQSCSGAEGLAAANLKMEFIPCSVYMNTPAYDNSDTTPAAVALSQIPDNLALRIYKEVDWYSAIIQKLQSGLDAGANPPTSLPADAPGADYKPPPDQSAPPGAAAAKKEGFFAEGPSGKCSPEAMKLRQQRKRQQMMKMSQQENKQKSIQEESEVCTPPNLQSEIDRVNGILNSNSLKNAIDKCAAVAAAAKKLEGQLALLKDGNLYDWQKSGPKKSYAQFKGGDRIAALTFSIQQNRG
jgi:hypothetical protein